MIAEHCTKCGHHIRFYKNGERIDNIKYGETHILDFLQPTHPFYQHFYGRPREINLKDPKKEMEELRRELKDDEKTWKHLGTKAE